MKRSAGALGMTCRQLQTPPATRPYRRLAQRVRSEGVMPPNLEEYFGYGIFVGQR
jgi:hypothetical protein